MRNRRLAALLLLLPLVLPAEDLLDKPFAEIGAGEEMKKQTRWVVNTLNRRHYLRGSVEKLDGREIIESFADSQDYARMYFYATDIDDFEFRFSDALESNLDLGNLYPAFAIFDTFRNRAKTRVKWVMQRLAGDFDFTVDETFAPDRRESPWPADKAESDALWERRLKYELLNEMLSYGGAAEEQAEAGSDAPDDREAVRCLLTDPAHYAAALDEAREVLRRRYERSLRYIHEREATEVQEAFLNSMTRIFDPHSTFFSVDTLEDFNTAVQNSFVGIGALLEDDDGTCTIKELLPGGPAERGGELGPEDKILFVGQGEDGELEDVRDMRLRHIVKKIKGRKGSTVRLLIQPGDASDPSERREIVLVRDEIKLTANLASAELLEVESADGGTVAVGVLQLPSFYGNIGAGSTLSNTSDDVLELVEKLKDAGIQGLVLDLRSNGGGLLAEAVRTAGLFIPTGPVVQVLDADGSKDILNDNDPLIAWDGPMVVLTSRFSASASEIVAGALRDHGRAVVVGDRSTHGKGTVQEIFKMSGSRGFPMFAFGGNQMPVATKITIKQFFLPDGSSTQLEGVPADIALPSANEFLPIGESDLPHAIAHDTTEPLVWNLDWDALGVASVEPELLAALEERSRQRQSTLDEFAVLRERIEWQRKQRERKEISLNLERRIERQIEESRFVDEMEETYDAFSECDYRYTEYVLDVTAEQENLSRQSGDADDDAPERPFDIHLRESARIIADWVDFLENGTAGNESKLAATAN